MKKFIFITMLLNYSFTLPSSTPLPPVLPTLTQEEWEAIIKAKDQEFFQDLGDEKAIRFMAGQIKHAVNPNPDPHTEEEKERAQNFKTFYNLHKNLHKEKKQFENLVANENEEFEKLANLFKKHTAAHKIQETYKKHRALSAPSMMAMVTPITGATPITHVTAITEPSETEECPDCKPTIQEIRFNKFKEFLMNFAQNNYSQFKRLVCTHEYLTQTDWLYQFIETMRDTTIFARNADGSINPNEFEKNINPLWLEDYIIQYIEGFHMVVYKAFIQTAIKKITDERMSWIDAVSIVAPKNQYGFEQGSRMYPIAFTDPSIPYTYNEFILGEILSKLPIPEKLNLELARNFTIENTLSYGETTYNFTNVMGEHYTAFGHNIDEALKMIQRNFINDFYEYFTNLGRELNPEEAVLESLIDNETRPEEYDDKFMKHWQDKIQFEQSHTNWRKAADQTFWLGCLIIDKNLDAFDALGGDAWLNQQPNWMQNALKPFIQKLQNPKQKQRFKQKSKNAKPITATPGSSALQSKKVRYPSKVTETITYIPDKNWTEVDRLANLAKN